LHNNNTLAAHEQHARRTRTARSPHKNCTLAAQELLTHCTRTARSLHKNCTLAAQELHAHSPQNLARMRTRTSWCVHAWGGGRVTVPHPPPKGSACGEKIQLDFANSSML
ncbi:MAG: hypothetical protein IJS08_01325, partial [Victivallales bacterium]|nr:hypothetical protein [Victivallales bacterium]